MPEIEIIAATKTLQQQPLSVATRKKRVAAYARVSTEQDEQQSSYEAQVDFYTRHIKSNPDWEFVEVFADRGITGTNTKNRENFNRMIDLALNGGIDIILTKSISRFARNTVDTLQTVRELKAVGVEVLFEKENLHTFDPKCEMMLTIMSAPSVRTSAGANRKVCGTGKCPWPTRVSSVIKRARMAGRRLWKKKLLLSAKSMTYFYPARPSMRLPPS